ncbi:TPA: DNA-protecting protein DprA, partial [Legionella pneumophila]|nr:DNA-protecting protein DprA [Legionella pneumophila]HEL9663826.1 DNA-protecting protein DprA [Legionella pneumophila]
HEIGAYEYLFDEVVSSYKQLSDLMKEKKVNFASELVNSSLTKKYIDQVWNIISKQPIDINVFVRGTMDYLDKLYDAEYSLPLLYYQGNLNYLHTKGVAVVGTRNPSPLGVKRTQKLVKLLLEQDITIISGLASGIDTVAHSTAIENEGRTIAVIGTPITSFYPFANKNLQLEIAKNHLLISQVPIIRYSKGNPKLNRFNFPERNKTMSAISDATIIVEASNTSGTLTQAKAALKQGRKLFILNNNFEDSTLNWPAKFEKLGAIRVSDFSQIVDALK